MICIAIKRVYQIVNFPFSPKLAQTFTLDSNSHIFREWSFYLWIATIHFVICSEKDRNSIYVTHFFQNVIVMDFFGIDILRFCPINHFDNIIKPDMSFIFDTIIFLNIRFCWFILHYRLRRYRHITFLYELRSFIQNLLIWSIISKHWKLLRMYFTVKFFIIWSWIQYFSILLRLKHDFPAKIIFWNSIKAINTLIYITNSKELCISKYVVNTKQGVQTDCGDILKFVH